MVRIRAVIRVEKISKKYKKVEAVREISFSVHKGEIFGFLGPNGAGKTSTIRIICGLSRPTSGRCTVLGKKAGEMNSKLGVVFEENNLYQRLSAEDNLNFFASLYDINQKRVEKLLRDFDLYGARKRLVRNYSRGMKQRLMICRALLNDPRILILDEPTSGLDPTSAQFIRESILAFKKRGKTILLTTHYMEEADELCDRVAFIDSGKIVALDNPDILKIKYGEPGIRISLKCNSDNDCADIIKNFNGREIIRHNGQFIELEIEGEEALMYLLSNIKGKADILQVHSRETSLAAVFMQLTGSSLT